MSQSIILIKLVAAVCLIWNTVVWIIAGTRVTVHCRCYYEEIK
jgi:hypothetical protein